MRNEGTAQSAYEEALKVVKDIEAKDRIIYDAIVKVAEDGGCVCYGDIAPLIGLNPRSPIMGIILEWISTREHRAGRPLLTAVVVKKMTGIPGKGFFKLAKCLKRQAQSEADDDFWEKELQRVHDYWSGRQP